MGRTTKQMVLATGVVAYLLAKLDVPIVTIALGLVLGGALGNLTDRLLRSPGPGRGHVVRALRVAGIPIVLSACQGGATDELVILASLLSNLTGSNAPSAVDSVWSVMAAEVAPLRDVSFAKIPAAGLAIDGAAFAALPFVEGKSLKYDPEAAKRLLAEAGYPRGFPVTFDCPTDRYVNDEAICTAIVSMLERVGIRVTPNFQTKSLWFDKIGLKGGNRTSFYMLGWMPNTFDAFNALQNVMTLEPEGHGIWNAGRYSNPRIEALTLQIQSEIDPDKRNALIREAFQIHQDDVGHIPLHQQFLAWGVADTIADIKQRPQNDVDLRYVIMRPASDDAAAQTPKGRRMIQD